MKCVLMLNMLFMKNVFCLTFVCIFLCSCRQENRESGKAVSTTSRFQPGQVWTFHSAPDELPGATLSVIRVDFDPDEGPIIYIWVKGVRQRVRTTYNFMAFSESALNESVVELVGTNAPLKGEDLRTFQDVYTSAHQGVKTGELDKCFNTNLAEVLEISRKTE